MTKVGEHITLDIIGTIKEYDPKFFEKLVYKIAKKAKLFGFNNSDLTQFTLDNIEVLLNKSLIEKEAIKLLRSNNSGVLSTISKINKDYPFGSFVTYATLIDRSAFFYLSDIAEHTKNLNYKSTACLTIVGFSSEKSDKKFKDVSKNRYTGLEKIDFSNIKSQSDEFDLNRVSRSQSRFRTLETILYKITKCKRKSTGSV